MIKMMQVIIPNTIKISLLSLFLFLNACTATLPEINKSGADRGGAYTKPPVKVIKPVKKPIVRKPVVRPSKAVISTRLSSV